MRKSLLLAFIALAGCQTNPSPNPDPIEVSGKVTLPGGKAVSDVVLNLQPTGTGGQATLPVKNGAFKGSVMPGRYTYYITEDSKNPAAFAAIPERYRAGAMDRQIDIAAGSTLNITLD
jgi:hypothetical protein